MAGFRLPGELEISQERWAMAHMEPGLAELRRKYILQTSTSEARRYLEHLFRKDDGKPVDRTDDAQMAITPYDPNILQAVVLHLQYCSEVTCCPPEKR
jgi:hypothetical protein